jgi:hypothetical protein
MARRSLYIEIVREQGRRENNRTRKNKDGGGQLVKTTIPPE